MKLTPRGFTLVELMIVIAIIGILAAALFPSLTSYLKRGRDTARASGIKEISTAIAAYTVDKQSLPVGVGNCVNSGSFTTYIQKWPLDPQGASGPNHCGWSGVYGYGTGFAQGTAGTTTAMVSAYMENANGWNTGTISSYQSTTTLDMSQTVDKFTKGFGSGYVVRN